MRRSPILLILVALIFTWLYPPCANGADRPNPRRFRGTGNVQIGIELADTADSNARGVLVKSVAAGSIGDAAGLMAGDLIVSVAGKSVEAQSDRTTVLAILMRMMRVGMEAEIIVLRDGKSITLHAIPSAPGTQSQRISLGIVMSDTPKDWNVEGAVVTKVLLDSPADDAGIMSGDILVDLNGQSIKNHNDLQKAVAGLATGQSYKVTARRGNQTLVMDATNRQYAASGSASNPTKRRLSDINVLKYAFIDPQSRVVTLVGKYDQNYKTGPIQYYELLNDALKSPYPWFSLEPTQATRNAVNDINAKIGTDVQRMYSEPDYCTTWANRLMGLILNDPTLNLDRARLLKKGAQAFQISENEMLTVLQKSLNPSTDSGDEMIPITGKILIGLGYNQVGAALISNSEGSGRALELLGITTEAQAIVAKFNSGEMTKDRASVELAVLIESAMLRGLNVPNNEIESRANNVLNGRMSVADFQKFMEDHMSAILVDSVGLKMFNGLTLSHELLSKLYDAPAPQMNLVFRDLPADSLLGDVLFRADYAMKSICSNPDVKERIPEFLSEMDYMYDASIKTGIRIPSDVGASAGHRLIPGEVRMQVSPSGTLVSFDDAQVKIIGWVIETDGAKCTPKVANFMKSCIEDYAGYMTQHYEELSKVYPELHRIREAEKLIALARWAKANNYRIVVDQAYGIRMAQAPTAIGFIQGVFTADQKEFSLTVIAEGGAAFDKDEGEAWIQPTVNTSVTADVSKQLVMSAVMAKQAAIDALGGDLEAARDMADKSARAMTGEIDLTQLPSLGDIPMPGDPAQTALLSNEAISAVDQNLRQIENAKVTMQKAADLENTSPADAAKLRESAEAQTHQAEANLQGLRDAMDSIKNDPGRTNEAVVTIRGLGKVIPASGTVANNTQTTPGPTITPGGQTATTDPQPALASDITPEQRAKWLAELASLESQLEVTKAQFGKLNKSIQQDRMLFEDWEKVATEGKDKCTGILYGLLMDAAAGGLSDRYEEMTKLAKKLPDNPQAYISKLERIQNWFKAMKYTQVFKDVNDMAARDGKTLPELLEEVRDDLNIIISVTPLDKTPFGAGWKFGTNVVDMAYSFTQFLAADDGINRMDKNNENYAKAVASLTVRMQTLVERIKELKKGLGIQTAR